MERKETNNIDKQTRILGDQIHAVDDLEIFRTMLRQEIKSLLQETSGQPVQQWMKSSEVRKMLGVSPETLQNLRVNGTLPFTKISSIVFYQYEDIVKLLNNQISK